MTLQDSMAALAQVSARLNAQHERVTAVLREYEAALLAAKCTISVMLPPVDGLTIGYTKVSGRWLLAYLPPAAPHAPPPPPEHLIGAPIDVRLGAVHRLPQLTEALMTKAREILERVEKVVSPQDGRNPQL